MNFKYKPYSIDGTIARFDDESVKPLELYNNILDKCDTLIFVEYDCTADYEKKYYNVPNTMIYPNIKHLKFGNGFNQNIILPKNLICVCFKNSFVKPVVLPKNLLFFEKEGDISNTVLGKKLEYLRTIKWYRYILNYLPKYTKFLCVKSKKFFQPCLSKNLLYVILNYKCSQFMLLPKNVRRLRLSLCFVNNLQTLKYVRCLDIGFNIDTKTNISFGENLVDVYFHAYCSTYHLVDQLPNNVKRIFYELYYVYNVEERNLKDYRRKDMPVIYNCSPNVKLIWNNFVSAYEMDIQTYSATEKISHNCTCANHYFF